LIIVIWLVLEVAWVFCGATNTIIGAIKSVTSSVPAMELKSSGVRPQSREDIVAWSRMESELT
jgi:hypothetical protein